MDVSVVLPTITGREHWLEKAKQSYEEALKGFSFEFIIPRDCPTVGIAWNAAAQIARGDYLNLSADDIEAHRGFAPAAMEKVDAGFLPAPRILNTDGSLQSCGDWETEQEDGETTEFTRLPFLSRKQWDLIGPCIDAHYYTDNYISHRGREHGIETVVARDYLLTHHLAQEGRMEERMEADRQVYLRAIA